MVSCRLMEGSGRTQHGLRSLLTGAVSVGPLAAEVRRLNEGQREGEGMGWGGVR